MDFPNLSTAKMLAIDVETCDPNLIKQGPGGVRLDGKMVGFSLATYDEDYADYFPLYHEAGGNIDNPENTLAWLKDLMLLSMPKVGANISYDLEWLRASSINVNGPKYDIQMIESLLDENKLTYKLGALSLQYLGVPKSEDEIRDAAKRMFPREKNVKNVLWKLPGDIVRKYGRDDALLTIKIFKKQMPEIEKQELGKVFDVESRLIDLLLDMRFQGIRVDREKAAIAAEELAEKQRECADALTMICGSPIKIWANNDISAACDRLGYAYPKTEKGNDSFPSKWLEEQPQQFFKDLLLARQYDRCGSLFVKTNIIDNIHNGRLHPQFWQVKTEFQGAKHGTKSGRFASSNPNGQNFPARNEELAKTVRSLLLPEPGERWCVADWSQQEYRVSVHYAYLLKCQGADIARQRYIDAPLTDYHQLVADMMSCKRKLAKQLNLALSYNMGVKKMARVLKMTVAEAQKLYEHYHNSVPFVKQFNNICSNRARNVGYVKTILGRRRRFDKFGPRYCKNLKGIYPLAKKQAIEKWGMDVTPWGLHKAGNSVVQGTSADMMKLCMLELYSLGYVPLLTIHDELDFSVSSDKQIKEIHDVMIETVKLEVPNKVDLEVGPSWGELEDYKI